MRAFALILCAVSLVSCKKGLGSNFEGEVVLETTAAGASPQQMIVKAKNDKLRFETTVGGKTAAAIFDPAQNKVVMLMDEQKAYLDMDFASPSAPQANVSASAATAEKTGKKDTVAGIDCEEWTVKDPSGKHTDVCLADGLAFFDLGAVKSGNANTPFSKQLRDKKQFPLRSVDFDASGKETSRTVATRIEKKKLDDAIFSVPEGYAKMVMPAK